MNIPHITAILVVTSLSFSAGAIAQNMSRNEYKTAEKNIVAEYKSAKVKCNSFSGNAKDICMAEVKGKENIAKVELKTRYKPSKKADYEVSVAKAQAEYIVAKEKCDDKAGKVKKGCVKEAKAALMRARSDAKGQLLISLRSNIKAMESAKFVAKEQFKASEVNTTTSEEISAARMKEKGSEAPQDAAADKP